MDMFHIGLILIALSAILIITMVRHSLKLRSFFATRRPNARSNARTTDYRTGRPRG